MLLYTSEKESGIGNHLSVKAANCTGAFWYTIFMTYGRSGTADNLNVILPWRSSLKTEIISGRAWVEDDASASLFFTSLNWRLVVPSLVVPASMNPKSWIN